MKVLFLGGDKRVYPIIKYMIKNNYDVDTIGFNGVLEIKQCDLDLNNYDYVFLPLSGISDNYEIKTINGNLKLNSNLLNDLKCGTKFFSGNITKIMLTKISYNNIISLLNDEKVKQQNDLLTVEGILEKIKNVEGNSVLILGYGNIGKPLYKELIKRNYQVKVGVEKVSDLNELNENGFLSSDKNIYKFNMKNANLIINTVPKNIIDKSVLEVLSNKNYILDISSYPYGIDEKIVNDYNIDYNLYSGIPGKYNPEKAGNILLDKIKSDLKSNLKVGLCITSSYCTLDKVLLTIKELVKEGFDVYPIVSENIVKYDTRFGKSKDFINEVENLTGKKVVQNIVEAESFGPKNKMDVMVVLPATGDFIAKLSNGITDNPVNLAVKATLRNEKPVVIAVSTNDGLGLNGTNIMKLLNSKNIYFVPFGQDNFMKKPNSLISHYDLLIPTIKMALDQKQLQPVLKEYKLEKK